jgi:ribosomal protein S3AE
MTENKTVISFFRTHQLAKNKLESIIKSKTRGDNSSYSIECKDGVFVIFMIKNYSEELQNQLNNLFSY